MNLHQLYHPITAAPFLCDESYMEFEPCRELKPFIRCFWGSRRPYRKRKAEVPANTIVVPDTCMDIIFDVDFTNNHICGKFCGIDDRTFLSADSVQEEKITSTFAIRFYVWSAFLFAGESMADTKNGFFPVEYHFSGLKKAIEPFLFETVGIEERIWLTQRYLLEHLHTERLKSVFVDAIEGMLRKKGNVEIGQLAKELHISSRHLERIFKENTGISPKQLASLIRYQYLWSDILFQPHRPILDAVARYGYADQPHLLHDFKRFHTMSPAAARQYALLRFSPFL